ncbi:MAG TPA: FmdB family zinc ribbon protein [Solirubrobacterales bacterium]|nr:FmdB family zinc ribbon protein [Solirubrobacterales bacterium]
MPIYEYKCDNGHVFDVMQKMSEEPLTECVECGAPAHRVLTAPAVHFKGSGFYNTDYGKRKGGGSNGSSDSSSGSSSSESSSASSDSGSSSNSGSDSKAAASSSSSSSGD